MSAQQHRASRCVFVGNIPYDATEEQLVQICEEVGPVVSFRLVVDRDTGKPKGYGFCEFRDEETALSARRNLQGYDINGRQLRVDFAENEKGGGGVDRNREQGRGGPGFQQLPGSHLDGQKQGGGGGGGGPQSGFTGVGGLNQFEHTMGCQAASAAAMVMAGALGGAQQQVSNVMMQGQVPMQGQGGPMQGLNVPQVPMAGNGGLAGGPDALTNHLAGMTKHQLYGIMSEMKILIQQDQMQARQILVANPQLTKALFQAQIMLGMVRPPQVAASPPPQSQLLVPSQQPVMQQQPPPPRPPQPHPPPLPQMQPQPNNKNNFQPPMPPSQQQQQQQQQQQLQQTQAPPSQQQQQQQHPPPPPQGQFQGGMVQTSMGMAFQQGPPPPAPNQLPPQQMYQMGSNMMGANLARIGANNNAVTVGQGNGGILPSGGSMVAAGTGQMARGPALSGGLGGMDNRAVQLNHGPPSSTGVLSAISGVPGQVPMPGPGSMSAGHSLVGGNGGGMGQSLPSNLTGGQLMGDPNNGRAGYAGMNQGMNSQINTGMNQGNTVLNAGMNTGLSTNLNSGLNPAMNTGMPQGLIQGFNQGINPAVNTGLQSNMNAGMNPGLTMGMNTPQGGGFSGTTDGTTVTSAALQSQGPYNQLQVAPAPQQQQGQVPLELEQQKALLQQVMNLTTEQIMSLPPDQRQQVLQLQQALR